MELSDDDGYLLEHQEDVLGRSQRDRGLLKPPSVRTSDAIRKYYDGCLLAVIICLPPTSEGGKPISIGDITLSSNIPRIAHHRNAMIGIGLLPAYQGKGYGSEAIEWILEWGFQRAGLHRIEIGGFSFNKRATDLYERLGFVPEGRKRECAYHEGAWHDVIELGMLEGEWRARRDKRLKEAIGK